LDRVKVARSWSAGIWPTSMVPAVGMA
jgi:hypothetical protein